MREEKCDRETVARIWQFPEVQNFIALAQREFFGLIPDAMAAVRHALQVDKKPTIGLAVLERTGVAANRGERMQLPVLRSSTWCCPPVISSITMDHDEFFDLPLASDSPASYIRHHICRFFESAPRLSA